MLNATPLKVSRHEFKYHIAPAQLPAITRYLASYCTADAHSQTGSWYPIQSLYLDSVDFRLYQEAAQKLPYRLKLRIRNYGDGQGPMKLEVKRKLRETIVKTSATLSRSAWTLASPGGLGSLHDHCGPSAAEFLQLAEGLRVVPKLLMRYERLAFSSFVDDYVRVTFDRRMTYQPVKAWDLAADPRAWRAVDAKAYGREDSTYVMEVKFCERPARWLRDMVLHFGLERGGFSKYCRAVRSTLEREPSWGLHAATSSFFGRVA